MTSSRLRNHPAYAQGAYAAEGMQYEEPVTPLGEQAFAAGFDDHTNYLASLNEESRIQGLDLTELLYEAETERDWKKLCLVVQRLIEDKE